MAFAAPALDTESLHAVTGLPRGAMVCLPCGVSWNGFQSVDCWCCGQPGITTAAADTAPRPSQ
jgi:hypothetical protein